MRLLHAKDLTFHEFLGSDKPEYAIISHRWSNQEISHKDFLRDRQRFVDGGCEGYGWEKIAMACKIALDGGYQWIWIDTICIDKSSSAELTEAINSMYAWYELSKVCYVFLPDVHRLENKPQQDQIQEGYQVVPNKALFETAEFLKRYAADDENRTYASFSEKEFRDSNWFGRAWTLQELLAPSRLYFYNSQFRYIGSRDCLASFISQTTGIPRDFVDATPENRHRRITNASVAERMKWASKRVATREEDIAYSLLGVFGVNMPLLYGEGSRAFRRLQTEIIRTSDDESIFAWSHLRSTYSTGAMLAFSIEQFSQATSIEQRNYVPRQHYEMTNKGLRLPMTIPRGRLVSALENEGEFVVLLPLNCVKVVMSALYGLVRYPIALRIKVQLGAASTSGSLRYMKGTRDDGYFIFRKSSGEPSPKSLYYTKAGSGDRASGDWFSDNTHTRFSYDLVMGEQDEHDDMVAFSIYIT